MLSACKANWGHTHTWVLWCPQIDDDLRDAEADHLRAQLALERERSAALSQRLGEAEGSLRGATARLNTRSVLGEPRVRLAAAASHMQLLQAPTASCLNEGGGGTVSAGWHCSRVGML